MILLILSSISVFSQKENYNWFFGNGCGISFFPNGNNPIANSNGNLFSMEGCASISDTNGNLLFYTNGETVWNKSHKVMLNGTGLHGSISSTQSSLIIKHINLDNIYYIFTTDAHESNKFGLCYSIVDINEDNGYGKVTTKNFQLNPHLTEKLTGIANSTQNGYWIICHHRDSNYFASYKLTKFGVDPNPSISIIGAKKTDTSYSTPFSTGYLKFSNSGNILASAIFSNDMIEIYDFDNLNGTLSNARIIYDLNITHPEFNDTISAYNVNRTPYGLEFSPNDKYLYASVSRGIKQIDLSEFVQIKDNYFSSKVNNINIFNNTLGALLLGPDKKIYVSGYVNDTLGVISEPDSLITNSSTQTVKQNLNGRLSRYGFPNFLAKTTRQNLKIKFNIENLYFCEGDSCKITALANGTNLNYHWSTGETTQSIIAKQTGIYSIYIRDSKNLIGSDSIYISINPRPIASIKSEKNKICEDELLKITALPNDSNYTYLWSNGTKTADLFVIKPGKYSVIITNNFGCKDTAEITIDLNPKPIATINNYGIKGFCPGDSAKLSAMPELPNYTYIWSNGAKTSSIMIGDSALYWVKIFNENGCYDSTSIKLNQYSSPKIRLFTDIDNIISKGLTKVIKSDSYGKKLVLNWSTGEATSNITIKDAGKYFITAIDSNGCTSKDSIEIKYRSCVYDCSKNIDFGRICIGQNLTKTFDLRNLNLDDARILSIKVKDNSIFQLSTFSSTITHLNSITPGITFNPNQIKEYLDTITIIMIEPCLDTFKIPISAASYAITQISIPDTIAQVGLDFKIPIYGELICGSEVNDNYNGKISFNFSLISPYLNQNNGLKILGLAGEMLESEIKGLATLTPNKNHLLNYFSGEIMLAQDSITPIMIDTFYFDNILIETKYKNGSVKVWGVCAQKISRIKLMEEKNFIISPNPARDFIEISFINLVVQNENRDLNKSIHIYNPIGLEYTPMIDINGLKVNISLLPSGIYYVKIGDKFQKFVKI